MSKVAYIVDSSSCISEKEAKDRGYYFLPLHVIIEGVDYLEGSSLDLKVLKQALLDKKNVSTSQASPGEIIQLLEQVKKDGYDSAVYAGISSGLSKTQETAKSAAKTEDFDLYVIDTLSAGNTVTIALEKAKQLIEEGMPVKEAVEKINSEESLKNKTFAIMTDLSYAAKGGRITPTAAALGNLLKITPLLYIDFNQGGKIDILEKVRTSKKAYKRLAELILEDVDDISNYEIEVADFYGKDQKDGVIKAIKELQPNAKITESSLSATIGVHTGPESIAAFIVDTRNLNKGDK